MAIKTLFRGSIKRLKSIGYSGRMVNPFTVENDDPAKPGKKVKVTITNALTVVDDENEPLSSLVYADKTLKGLDRKQILEKLMDMSLYQFEKEDGTKGWRYGLDNSEEAF
jgi:hypothetical protein